MGGDNLWRDRNKVFVAGIPSYVDDNALYEKFREFGEMFQSKVVYDNKTGKSKGFGFLTFSEYVNALEAVSRMNQTKWDNRVLNVRFLQPKTENGSVSEEHSTPAVRRPAKVFGPCPTGCTTIYVGNLAYGISEPVLRKVFEACGDIKAVRFAEHIETKEFRGFGYVQFYDGGACEKAVRLDGMIVMGRPMNIDYGSRDEATEKARDELQRKLKKGVCHRFQSGECPRGDECKFAHILSTQDADLLLHAEPIQATAAPVIGSSSHSTNDSAVPLCQSFLKGKCKRADKCKFLHVDAATTAPTPAISISSNLPESRVADVASEDHTPVCQSFLKGKCKRGDKCKYRHDTGQGAEDRVSSRVPPIGSPSQPTSISGASPDASPDIPVCLNYQKGTCKRGESCRFRHIEGVTEDKSMTVAASNAKTFEPGALEPGASHENPPVCQNYLQGKCKRGAACRYRHVDASDVGLEAPSHAVVPTISICKNFQRGRCTRGTSCRFAHTEGSDSSVPDKADVVAVASVSTAHSDYQKRFQSICYNWQNSLSCSRGDGCPFLHDGSIGTASVMKEENGHPEMEAKNGDDSKKQKSQKKSRKHRDDDVDPDTKKANKRNPGDVGDDKKSKKRKRSEKE